MGTAEPHHSLLDWHWVCVVMMLNQRYFCKALSHWPSLYPEWPLWMSHCTKLPITIWCMMSMDYGFCNYRQSPIFGMRDLEIWRMTWKNHRAPPLYPFGLCASFSSRLWIQIGVTVYSPETLSLNWNRKFVDPGDLEIWWKSSTNNIAPLLCDFKRYASLVTTIN